MIAVLGGVMVVANVMVVVDSRKDSAVTIRPSATALQTKEPATRIIPMHLSEAEAKNMQRPTSRCARENAAAKTTPANRETTGQSGCGHSLGTALGGSAVGPQQI